MLWIFGISNLGKSLHFINFIFKSTAYLAKDLSSINDFRSNSSVLRGWEIYLFILSIEEFEKSIVHTWEFLKVYYLVGLYVIISLINKILIDLSLSMVTISVSNNLANK